MDVTEVWERLVVEDGGSIVYVIIDGLGGLPEPETGCSELELARTPNIDALARESSCGLLEVVGPGITPGSGPGHLALYGYDPFKFDVGRGVLSALGIDFDLRPGDVAARVNFATVDDRGSVIDRRAGRIPTEKNRELCARLKDHVVLGDGVEFFMEPEKEHRAALVIRGRGLEADISDTDPERNGLEPLEPEARSEGSRKTEGLVQAFLKQASELLADQDRANAVLLRGFEKYAPFPSLYERFKLKGLCIAEYPMYRGISRLLGMDVLPPTGGARDSFGKLAASYGDGHDFYYLHVKKTDSFGEDGSCEKKVAVIEEVDGLIPDIVALEPDVLVVTADHSTPSVMKAHSFHPVPVLIRSEFARVDGVEKFDELSCIQGSLGMRPGVHLMGLALAHAGRLSKYGA